MKNYNLDLLKEQCAGDKVFFNEMLDIFIRSSLDGIRKMEEIYLSGDLKAIGHYAHKIISPCKHIQAVNLTVLLKELEAKCDLNTLEPERAGFLILKIKAEAAGLIKDLKQEYL